MLKKHSLKLCLAFSIIFHLFLIKSISFHIPVPQTLSSIKIHLTSYKALSNQGQKARSKVKRVKHKGKTVPLKTSPKSKIKPKSKPKLKPKLKKPKLKPVDRLERTTKMKRPKPKPTLPKPISKAPIQSQIVHNSKLIKAEKNTQTSTSPFPSVAPRHNLNKKIFSASQSSIQKTLKGKSSPASVSKNQSLSNQIANSSLKNYLNTIRRRIEARKNYPFMARRMGIEGRVITEFTIDKNGGLLGLKIKRTSGYTILDQAAINAIKDAAPFPPLPHNISKVKITIILPIWFQLSSE